MGRCKSLGSLKSLPFLSYASQLSGNSILCFSYPEFLRAHHRKWLQPNGCWLQGFFSFLSVLRAHIERLQSLITVTSLFTDMAGNALFLTNLGCMMWSPFAFLLSWYKEPCLHSNVKYLWGSFLSSRVDEKWEKKKTKERKRERKEKKEREERRKRKIRKQQCDQIWVKKNFFC